MKPILYPPEEREFNSNGLGVLSDAISCTVTWEGNGIFDLTMEYPMDGIHFDKIADRCIIMAIPTPYKDPQPFRIYDTIKNLDGTVTIYANHVAYDLEGAPVRAFSADNVVSAMASIETNSVYPSGFTFWTNKTTAAQFSMDAPAPIWKILGGSEGSILDVYGGEYEFDRWAVKLHDHLGQDNGVVIRYGKNMTDLEQERNLANLYTGVYPYWKGNNGEIVTCSPEVVPVEGTFDYTKILTLDASAEFQEKPTPEQLKSYAEQYIKSNNVGKPKVSITVSHEMLEQTDEYSGLSLLERCSVFDTVTVQFEKLGVNVKAKIVSADTDVLLERYINLKVGSVQANIADTIAGQQTELEKVPNTSEVQAIADRITQALLGAKGGSIRWLDTNGDGYPDTLYIADNPDPSKAVKVWRFNYEGWGASSNGYKGPFEMSAALGIGMYGQFITAGIINAALIKAGALQSKDGTTFYLDLDNGILRMNASEFTVSGRTVQQIADASSGAAAQQVAQQAQENLENYAETVTADLTSLQSQIDGQIMTFFYDYLPTSDNVPASEWTTDAEKQQHLGDLFYVVDNAEYGGQAYRWAQVNGAYQWILIEDTAVAQALEQSAQALDTADNKRRVFVAQPVPPYDVGDLWSQGPTGSLMVCKAARESGSYVASDWQSSADYINETVAHQVADDTVNKISLSVEASANSDLLNGKAWSISGSSPEGSVSVSGDVATISSNSSYERIAGVVIDVPSEFLQEMRSNEYVVSIEYKVDSKISVISGQSGIALWQHYSSGDVSSWVKIFASATTGVTTESGDWTKVSYNFICKSEQPTRIYIYAYLSPGTGKVQIKLPSIYPRSNKKSELVLSSSGVKISGATLDLSAYASQDDYTQVLQKVDGLEVNVVKNGEVRTKFAADSSSVTISSGRITFSGSTLVVDSDNFKLTEAGTVTITGMFFSETAQDRVDIANGAIHMYRKVSDGRWLQSAQLWSAGNNASTGNLSLEGPGPDGNQYTGFSAGANFSGGFLSVYNAAGGPRFWIRINESGDGEIWLNGRKLF